MLRSSDDKILYALGLSLAERLGDFELTPAEVALVQAGLQDGVSGGKTAVSLAQWAERVEKMLARRREATALHEKQRAREYYAAAEREAGAIKRPSGLIFRELRAGSGTAPSADSRVRSASRRTSLATTANRLPCSPAAADSIAALTASR